MTSNKHMHGTSGTIRRGAREMTGRRFVFHLAEEVNSLREDLEHTSAGRAAKTLAKSEGLRVTLVLIKQGFELNPEASAGGASLQLLTGRLRIDAGSPEPWDLAAGELIVLADNLRERIVALEETAFLLTVAWPAGAGAWEQELTGNHL
jgi:quercetin dioxygenase-like cupin family protein